MKLTFSNRINTVGLVLTVIIQMLIGVYYFKKLDLVLFSVFTILNILTFPYSYFNKKYSNFINIRIILISVFFMILYTTSFFIHIPVNHWALYCFTSLIISIFACLRSASIHKILAYKYPDYIVGGDYDVIYTNNLQYAVSKLIPDQTNEILSTHESLIELYNTIPTNLVINANAKVLKYYLEKVAIQIGYDYEIQIKKIAIISNDENILKECLNIPDVVLITDNVDYQIKYNAVGFDQSFEDYHIVFDLYILDANNFHSYKTYLRELNKVRTYKIIFALNYESILLENCLINGLKEIIYKKSFDQNAIFKILIIRVNNIFDAERNLEYNLKDLNDVIVSESANSISISQLLQFFHLCLDNLQLFNNKFTTIGFHKNISAPSLINYYNFDNQKHISYEIYDFHERSNESKSLFEINDLSVYLYKNILIENYAQILTNIFSSKFISLDEVIKLYSFH